MQLIPLQRSAISAVVPVPNWTVQTVGDLPYLVGYALLIIVIHGNLLVGNLTPR